VQLAFAFILGNGRFSKVKKKLLVHESAILAGRDVFSCLVPAAWKTVFKSGPLEEGSWTWRLGNHWKEVADLVLGTVGVGACAKHFLEPLLTGSRLSSS